MPILRALLSRVLNRFFALGLGVPLRDLSSGFRLYRTSALDMRAVAARDFDVLPEIVVRLEGYRVTLAKDGLDALEAGRELGPVEKCRVVVERELRAPQLGLDLLLRA